MLSEATDDTPEPRGTPVRRLVWALAAVAIIVAAAVVVLALSTGPASQAAPGQPNVIIFITDDQRDRGTMQVMPRTRRIFGRGGTRFENAFVTTPQCCPARASIYSGQYVHNHRVTSNQQAPSFDSERSWQHYLEEAGYRTAQFGKFLNGWGDQPVPEFDVVDQAYRHHDGYPAGPPGRDRYIGDLATRFIDDAEAEGDDPWAITMSFEAPHLPLRPEPRFANAPVGKLKSNPAMRERDFSDKNPSLLRAHKNTPELARTRAAQLRMLMTTDRVIDHVWKRIEPTGEASDTLAIFLSDNGYYWGEHRLRGKFLPYLDSVRVPMYARWDGHFRAGAVDRRYALNIDIAPTLFDALDIDPAYTPDGRSLLRRNWDRDWLLFEGATASNHIEWPIWRNAYYDGRRHYIRWRNGFRELYDLRRDPNALESTLSAANLKGAAAGREARALNRVLRTAARCRGPEECP